MLEGVVLLLLPLYGACALLVPLIRDSRIRGYVLLAGGLVVTTALLLATGKPLHVAMASGSFGIVAILGIALLAPPAIGGGNRVAKSPWPHPVAKPLVGVGGLAILLALFVPAGSNSGSIIGMVLGLSGDVMGLARGVSVILWVILLLVTALLAASYLVPKVDPKRAGDWLSTAVRFTLYGLPIALVLLPVLGGGFRRYGGFIVGFFVLAGLILRLYGLMILTAAGVALVLGKRRVAREVRKEP